MIKRIYVWKVPETCTWHVVSARWLLVVIQLGKWVLGVSKQ